MSTDAKASMLPIGADHRGRRFFDLGEKERNGKLKCPFFQIESKVQVPFVAGIVACKSKNLFCKSKCEIGKTEFAAEV